jgi:hypothetical protein
MKMDNVLIRRLSEPRTGHVALHATLEARNCTFENLDIQVAGTATWTNCIINGKVTSAGGTGADPKVLLKLLPAGFLK